ncbi:hypothetical protein LUZ60_000614 [Juncus effusus]|nr:hypothetical protein LUZ60_000614 [Juncus effusus]
MFSVASNLDLALHRSNSARAPNSIHHVRIRCISQFSGFKLNYKLTRRSIHLHVIDENYTDFHPLIEDNHEFSTDFSLTSSNEGGGEEEESDDDYDTHVYPYENVDLPSDKKDKKDGLQFTDASLPVAAHRLYGFGQKKRRIRQGMVLNLCLTLFISIFLLYFDSISWRIVRLPLKPYFLTKPFIISAATSALAGLFYTPLLDYFNIYEIIKKQGADMKISQRVLPTMGGLFFVPIGIFVGRNFLIGENNLMSYNMAVFATVCFGVIGFLDDVLRGVSRNYYGLFGWLKLVLQIGVGAFFSYWLDSASMSTPYTMKYLMPLPSGLQNLGSFYYLVISTFCLATMGSAVSATDGVDGLAGGVSALSFIGMSVAVLALSPELAIFGASMAGSCIGFLFHNRYKSSVLMGEIGKFAIGAALVSMAAFTGMFLPLFICTSLFSLEYFAALLQVLYYKILRKNYGVRKQFLHKAPIHRLLRILGFKDPLIVGIAYFISYFLALLAGYVGLISA